MKGWLLGVSATVACAALLQAHHSLTSTYDMSREITIEGVVTRFEFVNPHPFLTIAVAARGANSQQWRLEMDNRSELMQIGMTGETLKPGNRVVVTGSPGRSEPHTLYIRRLDRPEDGLRYEQVGAEPRIKLPEKK